MLRRLALLLLVCTSVFGAVQLASARAEANPASPPSIALKVSSRGAMVTTLQTRLRQLGFYSGAIDGQYGSSTKIAVEAFQRSAGLAVDGRVGSNTWQQLELAALTPVEPSPVAVPSGSPASIESASGRLALILLGCISIVAIVYFLRRWVVKQETTALAVAGVGNGTIVQIQSEQAATPVERFTAENGAASPNGRSGTAEAIEPAAMQEATTVQETTRLPKFDLAAELLKDLHSSDPIVRRKAIWELGQRGESQAMQPLVDLMIDSDSQQRSLILAAIAEIGSRTLKPLQRALMISLQDESADVRKNAIRDLTRIYDSIAQTSQLLTHALNDSDAEVQETAQWALNQLNRIRTPTAAENAAVLPNSLSEQIAGDRSASPQ